LEPVVEALRDRLQDEGLDHPLHLAAEYFADERLLALIEREPLLGFGPDSRRVLIEFAYGCEPLFWADILTALIRHGYTPVIAHVERYRFVTQNPEPWLDQLSRFPLEFQSNIGALAGQYGREPFEFAHRLLAKNLPTYWGTDLHRP